MNIILYIFLYLVISLVLFSISDYYQSQGKESSTLITTIIVLIIEIMVAICAIPITIVAITCLTAYKVVKLVHWDMTRPPNMVKID